MLKTPVVIRIKNIMKVERTLMSSGDKAGLKFPNVSEPNREIEKFDKNNFVAERNDIILSSISDLTLNESKIMDIIISDIKPGDIAQQPFITSINAFAEILGIKKDSGKNRRTIENSIRNLMKKQFEIITNEEINDGKEESHYFYHWIDSAKIIYGTGKIYIYPSVSAAPFFISLKKNYTQFPLETALKLKNQYSYKIYKMMQAADKNGHKKKTVLEMSLDDWRKVLNIPDSYRYNNIKERVFLKAMNDVNNSIVIEDMDLEMKKHKIGKKVSSVELINNYTVGDVNLNLINLFNRNFDDYPLDNESKKNWFIREVVHNFDTTILKQAIPYIGNSNIEVTSQRQFIELIKKYQAKLIKEENIKKEKQKNIDAEILSKAESLTPREQALVDNQMAKNANRSDTELAKYEKDVISYLNEVAGTNYKVDKVDTFKLVKRLFDDDYSLEDVKTVIDKKFNEWKDTKYIQYMRPSTLFGKKFDDYLNQPIISKSAEISDFKSKKTHLARTNSDYWNKQEQQFKTVKHENTQENGLVNKDSEKKNRKDTGYLV